jgi:hypothetical protein
MFQTEYEGDEEASEDEPEANEGQEEAENEEGANEEAENEEGAETSRPQVATADEENEAADSLEALRIDEAAQSTVSNKEQGENVGRGREIFCCRLTGSVVDPYHPDAYLSGCGSGFGFLFDADVDTNPTFHPDADPDPSLQIKTQTL